MKKNLLLLSLTTLMVLPGCGIKNSPKIMIEDTLAHEEIFGEAELFKIEKGREAPVFLDDTVSDPVVGVQYQESLDHNFMSIRFVAAIDIGSANLADVEASWTRAMYKPDGDTLAGKGSTPMPCKTAYTSLNNNGVVYSIDDFNSDHGTTNYDYFVVYTMLNVPITGGSSYADHYLNAYVDVGGAKSKELASRIDGGVKASFAYDASGYFLAGDINSHADAYSYGDNRAAFTESFAAGENFVIASKGIGTFKVFDKDCLSDDIKTNFEDSGSYMRVKSEKAGKYRLYLNNSNPAKLYASAEQTGVYLRGEAASGDVEDWDCKSAYQFVIYKDNVAALLGVSLSTGRFKIGTNDWSTEYGYWGYKVNGGDDQWRGEGNSNCINIGENFEAHATEGGGRKDIVCKVAGTYNIYITYNHYVSFDKVG